MEPFESCLETLKEQVKPLTNDIRLGRYVNYINAFLDHFGDERIHLVGSTGDGSKLSLPIDDGDADFLIVTGRIKVPADCLEMRSESPSYVWIPANAIPECLQETLTIGNHLHADILREVRPELFDFARGIYLHVSADIDRVREANDVFTSLGIRSKVGLALTTYKRIQIHGDLEKYRMFMDRNPSVERTGRTFIAPRNFHPEDSEIVLRISDLVKIAKRPENSKNFYSNFSFFASIFEEALRRNPLRGNENLETSVKEVNEEATNDYTASQEYEEETKSCEDQLKLQETGINESNKDGPGRTGTTEDITSETLPNEQVKMTFCRISNKDFVPAFRVTGQLDCMDRWKERVAGLGWSIDVIDGLYKTDVFLIARESIIHPNRSLDFCLAFGLHEQKLVKQFSENQKMVYLILKTFRRGIFDFEFRKKNMHLKFRTYHMKTLAFWTFENTPNNPENPSVFRKEEILDSTVKAVQLLSSAVDKKMLEHYFTGENLFANFDEQDFRIMREILNCIQKSPTDRLVECIKRSIVESGEIWLSSEEIRVLLQLQEDGGRQDQIDRIGEALDDFSRGLDTAKRDSNGRSALKQAFLDVARLALADEVESNSKVTLGDKKKLSEETESSPEYQRTATKKPVVPFGLAFKTVGKFLKKDEKTSKENIDLIMDFTRLLHNVVPKAKKELDKIGGPETVRTFFEGAAKMDDDTDSVNVDDILQLADRYLSCTEAEKADLSTELKVKLACIFL